MTESSRVAIEVVELQADGTTLRSHKESETVGAIELGVNLANALGDWGRKLSVLAEAAVEILSRGETSGCVDESEFVAAAERLLAAWAKHDAEVWCTNS